jgi:hypothetical protein
MTVALRKGYATAVSQPRVTAPGRQGRVVSVAARMGRSSAGTSSANARNAM